MSEVKAQAEYQPRRHRGGIAGALILIGLDLLLSHRSHWETSG